MNLIQEIFASRQLLDARSTGVQKIADIVFLTVFAAVVYVIVSSL